MFDKTRPVLVADDDVYFRLALTGLLKGPLGFSTVVEAGSLDEALEQLSAAAGGMSLALFDLSMPGMDGPGTLAAVRECYPSVRVAVVSASESRPHILAALEVGVHGYIPKRFGPNALVRALNFVIAGDIFVPPSLAEGGGDEKSPAASRTLQAAARLGEAGKGQEVEDNRNAELAAISARQREVLAFLVRGFSNKQIANKLSLGEGTVKVHVASLLRNSASRTGRAQRPPASFCSDPNSGLGQSAAFDPYD